MPTNQGLGATHQRAFRGIDYDPDLFAIKADLSDVENIEYGDLETLDMLMSQVDFGGDDVDETDPIAVFIGNELAPTVGAWVLLPAYEEEAWDVANAVSFDGQGDWGIMDFSTEFPISDWIRNNLGLQSLIDMANILSGMTDYEAKAFSLILNEWSITNDPEEARELAGEVYYYESKSDAFWEMVEGADPSRLVFYLDREYFEQEMGYDWYEGGELYESYGGDWDMYIESMIDLVFMEGGATADTVGSYIDQDSFMSEIEMEATTHEDSSGYYVFYG